jgi:purine nucleosidase/pyrimidine-specific ribonucleoside hydrolase
MPGQPTPIILDCDPGHDDAIAILLALASPELELLGISTVAGNTTVDKTTVNALKVLELIDRTDVPVAMGAAAPLRRELHVAEHVHGTTGLDGPHVPDPSAVPIDDAAVDAIARWVAECDRPVTLVPTGPLTNIALLLARHPAAIEHIDRVVLMGGAVGLGNITPAAEFNIWVDPEAAAAVFAADWDVTMIGLEVTHRALLSNADQELLARSGRVGSFVAELLTFFRRSYQQVFGEPIAPIHDAAAVAHLLDPSLIETRPVNIEVEVDSDLTRGKTVVDLLTVSGRPVNARVGVDVDGARFAELLTTRIIERWGEP